MEAMDFLVVVTKIKQVNKYAIGETREKKRRTAPPTIINNNGKKKKKKL